MLQGRPLSRAVGISNTVEGRGKKNGSIGEVATVLGGRVASQAAANSTQLSYQQSQPTFRGVHSITLHLASPLLVSR